jgi:hypothetical protein
VIPLSTTNQQRLRTVSARSISTDVVKTSRSLGSHTGVRLRLAIPFYFVVYRGVTSSARLRTDSRPKVKWPHFWGHSLKRQWKVMSGKAMQETVPPAGTAIWEMSKAMEESEAHGALYGLFYYM